MATEEVQVVPAGTEKKKTLPIFIFFKDSSRVFKMDALGKEILGIAIPAAMALAADPIASLIDTAFIGRIGAVEIAAVGASITLFNQVSKVAIYPLVSITTSFVAEEETVERMANEAAKGENLEKGLTKVTDIENPSVDLDVDVDDAKLENLENGLVTDNETKELPPDNVLPVSDSKTVVCKSPSFEGSISKAKNLKSGKRNIPSASTSLIIGAVLGILETIFLICLTKPLLGLMGIKAGDPRLMPAEKYLILRSLGAPAVLLSLAMQGIFRGFKDTRTPLYATVAGDAANIILDPILIFACHMGVSGAAIAHVLSQYLISLILLVQLLKEVDLMPPSLGQLQFSRFLKNGSLLLFRVVAATICVTLATAMAGRLGPNPAAAFQICIQVWLASSLLADGMAVAGQAIIASALAEKNYEKATAAACRVLQMGFVMGLGLAVFVGLGLQFGHGVFTKDKNVVHYITICVLFVAGTQPLNSVAFVFDGVNFGASDFTYSAYSMVLVAIGSIGSLFALYRAGGLVGIWIALSIYMALRTIAGIWRMGSGTGPWRFLWGRSMP